MSSMRRTIKRTINRKVNGPNKFHNRKKGQNKSRGFRSTKTVLSLHADLFKKHIKELSK